MSVVSFGVEERLGTSPASCGHTIEKGEKYLVVYGQYRGHASNKTYCKKCALAELRQAETNLDAVKLDIKE